MWQYRRPLTARRFPDNRFRATNDGNRSGRPDQCCRAASSSGIRGGSIRCRGIGRAGGNLRCWPPIAYFLCLVKDAAVEQQVTLLGSHLLFASRPDFLRNPASFKLSPCIRFITTAPVLDGATALCKLGATARRIVVGHLSQCWQSDKRNSDGEHCPVHGVNSSMAHVAEGSHSSGLRTSLEQRPAWCYSLRILSAHSTEATKSGGVTNRAFL